MLTNLESYLPDTQNWVLLVIGAFLSVAFSLLWLLFQERLRRTKQQHELNRKNQAWIRFNSIHPTLMLAKAGPEPDGTFAEGSFDVTLESTEYNLPDAIDQAIRRKYENSWKEAGHTDDLKVGFKNFQAYRISDIPNDILHGKAHCFKIRCHVYRYFDFLATHRRLAQGLPDEMSVLNPYIAESDCDKPVDGFPKTH